MAAIRRWPSSMRCRAADRPPCPVGGADRPDLASRLGRRVDDHQRQARVGHPPQRRLVGQVEHAERAEGAARGRDLEPTGELAGGADAADDHADLGLGRGRDRAPDQLVRPQAAELADQQVDDADAGPRGDLVAVRAQDPAEPLPGLGGNVGPPVEHLRHGRDGHPGRRGDAGQAARPAGTRRPRARVLAAGSADADARTAGPWPRTGTRTASPRTRTAGTRTLTASAQAAGTRARTACADRPRTLHSRPLA